MNLDALLEANPVKVGTEPCAVGKILIELPEPYKSALRTQLETKYSEGGSTDEDIALRLRSAGLKAGASTINRHRRQKCICPTEEN